MKRKALLVSYSGWDLGQPGRLKGVSRDIARYRKYLMSNRGGAWFPGEIEVIADKNLEEIIEKLEQIKGERNNLVFTVYTGHGAYHENKNCRVLAINKSEYIFEEEFLELADRQISIFDSCSNITFPAYHEEGPLMDELILEKVATDSKRYRKAYEEICMACPPQSLFFYAASKGHTAYDTPDGSLYTNYLVNRLEESKTCMDIVEAHENAWHDVFIETMLTGKIQMPSMSVPEQESYLPGAIVLGWYNNMR